MNCAAGSLEGCSLAETIVGGRKKVGLTTFNTAVKVFLSTGVKLAIG
jgi:hypothetical protein